MTGGQRACSRCGGGEYEEESFCRMTDAALAGGTAARRDALCGPRLNRPHSPLNQTKPKSVFVWGRKDKAVSRRSPVILQKDSGNIVESGCPVVLGLLVLPPASRAGSLPRQRRHSPCTP